MLYLLNIKLLSADQYRSIFSFSYFNFVQSQVLDDILYTDKPLVVSAPTGSGKTVLFELAILRLLISQGGYDNRTKVVYMAPIKVLCSQRCDEWKEKFEPLGLKCQELTGDTDIEDFYQLQAVNIIFTTPEKWDSMTRKWRDNHSLVQLVKLFLIDEVHSLNEETRGATVEAVISRMKTVQASLPDHQTNSASEDQSSGSGLRFLAVSATIPNIKDIAEWLGFGNNTAVYHKFDDNHRPVKLRKVVLGYPCSENFSEFKFDLSLNYKLSGVIQTYSENKPSLVFCATRKAVEQAASILVKEARFILNAQCRQRLQMYNNRIRDSKLRDLVMNGVGYHHAGLDLQDRKAIEEMFLQGDLPVLMATSTLAMGVNLPAHLVVVKSTQHYACGMYTEYSETQILQMIGRAGRPQFDTTATAVIMTKHKTKMKYDNLLNGTEEIESSLHNHLIEHLNAEIVLHTINNMDIALEWLKSTFLYIRIQKNPTHYGLPKGLTQIELEKKLKEMCTKDLASLASINLIQMDQGSKVLKPLETGRLMARYCVAFETMKQFTKLTGNETVADLMVLLSKCKEFSDVQLRVNERKVLNKMNKDKNHVTIRYPMNGKIKTNDMKVNCLIQATLGSIPIQEFALNQDCYKIFRAGQRLTRCLTEYLMTRTEFKALLNAVITSKCIQAKLWENSKYVARQLEKIGPTMSNALVHAGLDTFEKLENKNPRELELIVNRHPPFGNQIVEAVSHLPKYDVSIEQISKYSPVKAELNITVCLQNHEKVAGKQTTKLNHNVILLIGDANNKVVYKQRIADSQLLQSGIWMRKIEVKRAMKGEDLSINLISQDFVGLDVQSVYTPFYSGPKHLRAAADSDTPPPQLTQKKPPVRRLVPGLPGRPIMNRNQLLGIPDTVDSQKRFTTTDSSSPPSDDGIQDFEAYGSRKPCSHRCLDKDTCAHDCCKFGIPVRPPPRPRAPSTKRLQTPDQGLPTTGSNTSMNSYDPKSIATTPSRSRGLHGIDGILGLMRQRARDITVTPNIKRLKFSDSTPTPLPKLDQFAYTPKRNLLPAMNRAAATPTSKPPPTTVTPNPKEPQRAIGWEHLDFYRNQRQMELTDLQSEESCEVEEDYGGNDNDELPEISLGFDKRPDDLPCFDIGGNDIYDVDDMDDIIYMGDLEDDFHQDLSDNMKENLCPPAKSSECPNYPPKQTPGYLWTDMPPRQPCPIQEQSVPNVSVPPGRILCRGKPAVAASSATLSMPVMEYSHTSNAADQYVPLVRRGHSSHQSMRPAYNNTLRGSYGPVGGLGVQSLPRPQLSTAWTKPLPNPASSGKPGTRQPERSPLKLLYGKAVRNLGFNPVTPTTKPRTTCPASNTSPDEMSLVTCLDAVEQDYLQKKQGSFSKYSQRPSGFFVNTSPEADDIPEFDSIFKDLF
ncbi:probable ATP-dependent DNA helicase HFM1 [Lytechinus variegatus]|uniref:probable ATP-dependent DNA helicase HFM1 n=1 Tax=Lytechinus variegatus TaxID=7654 RepID=UPI001BB1CB9D|nr:probable ATP-dependent DNA helicase HFM1 [Lytechinus variegatus]